VRTHLHRIYEKLNVSSKIELARAVSEKVHADDEERKNGLTISRPTVPRLAIRKFSVKTSEIAIEVLQTEMFVRISQRFFRNQWISVHFTEDTEFSEFTLDGTVSGSENSLSINAFLLDNRDQQIVWSGRRLGAPCELAQLVDELSTDVAGVLTGLWPGVPSGRKRGFGAELPKYLSAYEYDGIGIERLYQTTPRSYSEVAKAMRLALKIEPRYVPALIGLSISLSMTALTCVSLEQLDAIEAERFSAIEKAQSISPKDPPVLVEAAWLMARVGNVDAAAELLEEAIAGAPHSADLLAYAALRGAFLVRRISRTNRLGIKRTQKYSSSAFVV